MSTSRLVKEISTTKAFYEKYAYEWAQKHSNSFYHEKEFRILKKLLKENASVVDIGCAAGVLVPLFLGIGKGLRYHGIDITKRFIKMALERYPQLTFTEGDIAKYETLPRKKFDAFIGAAVLMHLPFTLWDTAFSNIEKLSKPKAFGYIVLPAQRPPLAIDSKDTRHFTLLPQKDQVTFMKKRGWKIIKTFKHATGPNKASWVGYIVQLP